MPNALTFKKNNYGPISHTWSCNTVTACSCQRLRHTGAGSGRRMWLQLHLA
jgi:hypothetical protein